MTDVFLVLTKLYDCLLFFFTRNCGYVLTVFIVGPLRREDVNSNFNSNLFTVSGSG